MAITKRIKNRRTQYRYEIRYKDAYGQTRRKCSKWYETKTEAMKALKDFQNGPQTPQQLPTLADVIMEWDCSREKNNLVSRKTRKEILNKLEKYFAPWYPLHIDRITPLMLRQRFDEEDIRQKSTETKNKLRTALKQVFDYAIKYHALPANPVIMLDTYRKTPAERRKKAARTIWTPEQFTEFIACMDADDDYTAMFQFIYWLGLRRSEALGITFQDVSGGVLHLHRKWDVTAKEWDNTLKNYGSDRYIKLPKVLTGLYIQQCKKYTNLPGFTDEWFLFGGPDPLTRSTMDRRRKKAIALAGLPYVDNHALRHSFISVMLQEGENAFKVARSVGHVNTDVTLATYAHIQVSDLTADIDNITDNLPQVSALN